MFTDFLVVFWLDLIFDTYFRFIWTNSLFCIIYLNIFSKNLHFPLLYIVFLENFPHYEWHWFHVLEFIQIDSAFIFPKNSMKIVLFDYIFNVNLTRLYSGIQLFSSIIEIGSKHLPPGIDRISTFISDKMLELSGDICRPTNSFLT